MLLVRIYEVFPLACVMVQAAQAITQVDEPGCGRLAGYLTNRAPGLSLATAALNTALRGH